MEGKRLLDHFIEIAPLLPRIMNMENNVVVWATDSEKYTLMIVPKTVEWKDFNTKEGDPIRAGIGPVVMKTKKPSHAIIPSEVFGVPLRASAYPIIEKDEVIGVIGISFGVSKEKQVSDMASKLANICAQLYYQ